MTTHSNSDPFHGSSELHAPTAVATNDEEDVGDLLLRVAGIVPGDEFDGFVVRIGRSFGLRGWVMHDHLGALVRAVGTEDNLVALVRAIRDAAPVSARVRGLEPELIGPDTVGVGEAFVAIAAPTEPWCDPAASEATLAHRD